MRRLAIPYDLCSRVRFTGDILCVIGMAHSGESVCTGCTRHTGSR